MEGETSHSWAAPLLLCSSSDASTGGGAAQIDELWPIVMRHEIVAEHGQWQCSLIPISFSLLNRPWWQIYQLQPLPMARALGRWCMRIDDDTSGTRWSPSLETPLTTSQWRRQWQHFSHLLSEVAMAIPATQQHSDLVTGWWCEWAAQLKASWVVRWWHVPLQRRARWG